MKILSRAKAKQAELPRYFTGEPCKYGHVAERMTSNRHCVACLLPRSGQWKRDNREKATATSKAWRAANADRVLAIKRAWAAANPESQKLRSRKWYLANKARADAQHAAWASRNPAVIAAAAARYRATELQRTPAWADLNAIKVIYQDAAEFRGAGLEVDVDHIIPLRGEFVSGLHVPENLRVCLSSVNRSKSNTYQIL